MNTFIIDAKALSENISAVRSRTGERKLYAVVKGNGYGFGLCEYVRRLMDCGISAFAVTEPHEAAAIRACGAHSAEILMLRSTAVEEEVKELMEHRAVLTIGSPRAATVANSLSAELNKAPYPVHIKVDTGMGRYGFLPNELEDILSIFKYMENLRVDGMFTHLNCAFGSKKRTNGQIDTFLNVEAAVRDAGFNPGCVHYANSATLFRFGERDLRDAVRIGSALTGRLAVKVKNSGLSRIGYLESRVCEVRWLTPGATVGYGGAYRARHGVKTAVIPLGYSHGFAVEKIRDSYRLRDGIRYILQDLKRTLTRESVWVNINGKRARVLGHVGMLHTVIDVTEIPCEVGDRVTVSVNPLYVDSSVRRRFDAL